jgi:hypothetical protein
LAVVAPVPAALIDLAPINCFDAVEAPTVPATVPSPTTPPAVKAVASLATSAFPVIWYQPQFPATLALIATAIGAPEFAAAGGPSVVVWFI